MPVLVANNVTTTLATGSLATDVILNVSAGTGASFPSPAAGQWCYATLVNNGGAREIVKITSRSVDALTVVRGIDGTTALAWNAGDTIEMRGNAGIFNDKLDVDTAAATYAPVYDISLSVEGLTLGNEKIFNFTVVRAFTWPVNLTNSRAKAGTAATASATFSITRNGSAIGSFTFAAAATTATFTFSSPVTFAPGDVIQITAPATADTTLADMGITFAGTR